MEYGALRKKQRGREQQRAAESSREQRAENSGEGPQAVS
jgi:hypothetical protein